MKKMMGKKTNPLRQDENLPQETALPAGLYLVALPIGNAEDVSLRALSVLARADAVFCEDTRRMTRFLRTHQISARALRVYHDHSPPAARARILEDLARGQSLALVSDAGTPLISDPGYKLVRAAVKEGHALHALPGPASPIVALLLSALPPDRFLFAGFLPPKKGARCRYLALWKETPATLIFFCPARRLAAALHDMVEILGNRAAAVAREMTKTYEDIQRGDLLTLLALYEKDAPKGEVTLVVAPPEGIQKP